MEQSQSTPSQQSTEILNTPLDLYQQIGQLRVKTQTVLKIMKFMILILVRPIAAQQRVTI